jgi:peptidoglycan/xylan/chitin deacetylase (PgdA/CDA1 family)
VPRLWFVAKWTFAHVLYVTGVLHALKRIALRNRAVVLMYHRVLSDEARAATWSHPGIVVRSRTFQWQMRLLQRQFRPLTLARFTEHLVEARPFPAASCLVTFDDGWLDTFTEAWPLLRREGVPAVVFLPTGLIGTGEMFWQERLKRMLHETCERSRRGDADPEAARRVLREHGFDALLDVPAERLRSAVMQAVQSRKLGSLEAALEATRALDELGASRSGPPGHPDAFASWREVREMVQGGVEFGGHGVTHRLLSRLLPAEVAEEARGAREAMARELGHPPGAFAYPNGDFNGAVSAAVQAAGYHVAFSTQDGHVTADAARFSLRRVNIHEDATSSRAMFVARLVGLL